jgi:hypothetical protein
MRIAAYALRRARRARRMPATAVRVEYLRPRRRLCKPSAVEARKGPFAAPDSVSESALSLALGLADGAQALAERWLAPTSTTAGEELRCALPPAALALEPGDLVDRCQRAYVAAAPFRVDRVDRRRRARDRRAPRRTPAPPDRAAGPSTPRRAASPKPVAPRAPLEAVLLELPPLTGPGGAGGPPRRRLRRARGPARPRSGVSADGEGWAAGRQLIGRPAVIGERSSRPPPVAAPHRWARGAGADGAALGRRRWLPAGRLRTLNGANAAAAGDFESGAWESRSSSQRRTRWSNPISGG